MSGEGTSDEVRERRTRARWYVHLSLLAFLAAAVVSLAYLSVSISIHAVVGLVFVGLVLVHLLQRRRTVTRLLSQLARAGSKIERKTSLAISDAVLSIVFLNVVLSGVVDWMRGAPVGFPLPPPLDTWHRVSGIVLVVYLGVHIWHRRNRLRRSVIR